MPICRKLFISMAAGKPLVVNWKVNKHLSLGATVVNFLNQKGAKGTISGSELITKDEASQYAGCYMSGSYLRPFTVEFSASLKF